MSDTQKNGKQFHLDLTGLPALPDGWCWTPLATIAQIDGGITKDGKRRTTPTMREVPYLRVANVQRGFFDLSEVKTILAEEEEIQSLLLQEGDVLFTEGGDRDKLGRGWVWRDEIPDCIHQNHIFRARLCRDAAEPKFVSYHGNHFGQSWFVRTGKQTTNLASINKGVLSRFPVPLAPVQEQRRIVAKIEELFSDLDAGVAALERVRANLKRYRAAVLKAAVEGRLTAEWRTKNPPRETGPQLLARVLSERRRKWEEEQLAAFAKVGKTPPAKWKEKYKELAGPDCTNLPALPEGWCWASVAQVAEVQGGIQKQPKRKPSKNAYPFLRVANVYRNRLDLSEVHKIELFGDELDRLRLQSNDLLVVEGNGSITEIGRSALWHGEIQNCVHQNHIIRVRFLAGLPSYLNTCWNSPSGNARVMEVAASTSGLYTLSVAKVSSLPVPLPPICEQEQIANEVDCRVSILEQAEVDVAAAARRSSRLRHAILRRAFEGKLVSQDPADEPADVLLQRVEDWACIDSKQETKRHNGRTRTRHGPAKVGSHRPEGSPGQ